MSSSTAGPNSNAWRCFEGKGISYWASPIEARLCAGEDVALVGGGNSAGQGVVFLAPQVKHAHLVVWRLLEPAPNLRSEMHPGTFVSAFA